jgi:hypothetical protein
MSSTLRHSPDPSLTRSSNGSEGSFARTSTRRDRRSPRGRRPGRPKVRPNPLRDLETFLGWKVHTGVVDFWRKELGRTRFVFSNYTHERAIPDFLSLDGGSGKGQLDGVLAREQIEFEAGRIDLSRVLAD